ncbi:keratin, type I cytoskeletal 9-like [Branchiostoma lanceolatum]|uniref:keratin, type I cytoskeletal 9-like n=1 Tax=Branchiostoma lanceolatum TaxID=7740 RepID=UPI00345370B8
MDLTSPGGGGRGERRGRGGRKGRGTSGNVQGQSYLGQGGRPRDGTVQQGNQTPTGQQAYGAAYRGDYGGGYKGRSEGGYGGGHGYEVGYGEAYRGDYGGGYEGRSGGSYRRDFGGGYGSGYDGGYGEAYGGGYKGRSGGGYRGDYGGGYFGGYREDYGKCYSLKDDDHDQKLNQKLTWWEQKEKEKKEEKKQREDDALDDLHHKYPSYDVQELTEILERTDFNVDDAAGEIDEKERQERLQKKKEEKRKRGDDAIGEFHRRYGATLYPSDQELREILERHDFNVDDAVDEIDEENDYFW